MRYKKYSLTISISALATLLLTSCTQDIQSGDDAGNQPALLQLNSLQATDINVATTRTGATQDYPTTKSVGFFVKEDATQGYEYNACNNYKGTYSNPVWAPTPDILLNSHEADIAVYAPYDIQQATPAALKLTACLRPADGSKDIWCECFKANNKSRNLALTLKHVYTRLSLTLSRDTEYKADAVVTDIALDGNEIYSGTTYHFFETTPYTYDGLKGFSTSSDRTLDGNHPQAEYDMLLIPTKLTGDITLTLTVNGEKMQAVISKEKFINADTPEEGSRLQAGKQYNISLTLKPGKVNISTVEIVKWIQLTEVNGGDLDYDPIS